MAPVPQLLNGSAWALIQVSQVLVLAGLRKKQKAVRFVTEKRLIKGLMQKVGAGFGKPKARVQYPFLCSRPTPPTKQERGAVPTPPHLP